MTEQPYLDEAAAGELSRLVRLSIQSAVVHTGGPVSHELEQAVRKHPLLDKPAGAFVTIYVWDQLRGCLGEIDPAEPLVLVAARCARRVPCYDYRFSPVLRDELIDLAYKISVLTPAEKLTDMESIRIGEHGLIVRHDEQMGLLLPDVATEHGWDAPTFVRNLWRKAGLSDDISYSEALLWTFKTQIIGGKIQSPKNI